MEELTQRLLSKAQRSLYNLSEVTTELAQESLSEAMELVGNKPIPQTMLLDLAMLRLKLNLKIELNEYEEKQQLFILKKAESIKVDEEGVPGSAISYGARVSEWDM
jgi:hypothetical protein